MSHGNSMQNSSPTEVQPKDGDHVSQCMKLYLYCSVIQGVKVILGLKRLKSWLIEYPVKAMPVPFLYV